MDREIKFRILEIKANKFWAEGKGISMIGLASTYRDLLLYPELYKLLEYTGVKDKNGKEIYEGDIVGQVSWRNEVIFIDGGFKVNGWTLSVYTDESLGDSRCVVLGNIYQNPELLKI